MVRIANKRETVFDSDTNIVEVFLIVFHSFLHVVAHETGRWLVFRILLEWVAIAFVLIG